jgi:magnesium-transporting ATPase (P-type)
LDKTLKQNKIMQAKQVSMKRYVAYFCAAYVVLSAIFGAILIYFDIDRNSPGILITLVSAAASVFMFEKEHKRPLLKEEVWTATWGSWASTLFLTVIALTLIVVWFIAIGEFTFNDLLLTWDELEISKGVIAGIVVFVLVLHLGVTRLGFGVFNRIVKSKLEKENSSNLYRQATRK